MYANVNFFTCTDYALNKLCNETKLSVITFSGSCGILMQVSSLHVVDVSLFCKYVIWRKWKPYIESFVLHNVQALSTYVKWEVYTGYG